MKILLTCEHAGNLIPEKYADLFISDQDVLETHRGYDPGALDLYNHLFDLSDYQYYNEISRLLVELNRSIGHPNLFSKFSKTLSFEEKEIILKQYYFPYRDSVEKTISKNILKGERLLHFSVHSFTPVLHGEERKADVGLLYDPSRKIEKEFCKILKQEFSAVSPELNVRFNYPYLGKADGFTTYLRKKFSENYAGIEIEVNQKFVQKFKMGEGIKSSVYQALKEAITKYSI